MQISNAIDNFDCYGFRFLLLTLYRTQFHAQTISTSQANSKIVSTANTADEDDQIAHA